MSAMPQDRSPYIHHVRIEIISPPSSTSSAPPAPRPCSHYNRLPDASDRGMLDCDFLVRRFADWAREKRQARAAEKSLLAKNAKASKLAEAAREAKAKQAYEAWMARPAGPAVKRQCNPEWVDPPPPKLVRFYPPPPSTCSRKKTTPHHMNMCARTYNPRPPFAASILLSARDGSCTPASSRNSYPRQFR